MLVRPDGSHVVGPQSVAELLRMSRPPFQLAGALMQAPGVRHALAAIGPHMYQQWYRLPGATAACRTQCVPSLKPAPENARMRAGHRPAPVELHQPGRRVSLNQVTAHELAIEVAPRGEVARCEPPMR